MKNNLFLLLCVFLFSCGENSTLAGSYVQCDTVVFIKGFPKTIALRASKPVNIQAPGVIELYVIDSLLLVQCSSDPFFRVFDLNTMSPLGGFVHRGNGPGELIISKRIAVLYNDQGAYFAELYNDDKRLMEVLNVSESIRQKRTIIASSSRKPQRALGVYFVNDSIEYAYALNDDYTQVRRHIKINDKPVAEVESARKLSQARVQDIKNINLLTSVIAVNREQLLVAEAPLSHKQINLYALLDSSVSKTICLGSELHSIEDLSQIGKNELTRYYGNIRGYCNFFAALYVEKQKNRPDQRPAPSLHLFNWKGEPLVCIQLAEQCDSFDIDLINKKLITVDMRSENILMYELPTDIASL